MNAILTGVMVAVIGWLNLATSRKHPERINASLLGKMGWLGIGGGALLVVFGILSVLKPNP